MRERSSIVRYEYDVFISYRRDGGSDFADALKVQLEALGVRCHLDHDELKTGYFDEKIYNNIDSSRVVVALLTKGSLDRCVEEGDWVRNELVYSIKNKNGDEILPVANVKDYVYPSTLPPELARFPTLNRFWIDSSKMQSNAKDFVENCLPWVSDREKEFRQQAIVYKHSGGVIDDTERGNLFALAENLGIPHDRCIKLIDEVEQDLACLPKGRGKKLMIGICALVIIGLVGFLLCKSKETESKGVPNKTYTESENLSSQAKGVSKDKNAMTKATAVKTAVDKINCVAESQVAKTSDASLEKQLSQIPSLKSVLKLSLASPNGVQIKNENDGNYVEMDYLFKLEIDRSIYDREIRPVFSSIFGEVSVSRPETIRFLAPSCGMPPVETLLKKYAKGQKQSGCSAPRVRAAASSAGGLRINGQQQKQFVQYISRKGWSESQFLELDGEFDSRAQLSSPKLGEYRGESCGTRIGDGKRDNMKAVVITEADADLAIVKGVMYELTPPELDKLDGWFCEMQSRQLGFNVILTDDKGKELACTTVTLGRYDRLTNVKYMSYWGGDERNALLVTPFVGADSLAFYKWVRVRIPAQNASRVVSVKIECE